MAFHERMLPIFADTIVADWIETWEQGFEPLNATYVIPGHGHPTNMARSRSHSLYFARLSGAYLRKKIGEHLEEGGDLIAEAYYIDQSPYARLDTFEELAEHLEENAGRPITLCST